MKHKRFVAVFTLFLLVASSIVLGLSSKVYADSCLRDSVHPGDTDLSESDASKISSLVAACNKCTDSSTTSYGAMWVNGFNATNNSDGVLYRKVYDPAINVSASITDRTVSGYLHGQAYSCVSSISAGGMPAGYIYFLGYAVPEYSYTPHSDSEVIAAQVDYIVNAEEIKTQVLKRAQGGVDDHQWTKPNGTIEVKIDLDKFIEGITPINNEPIVGRDGYLYNRYKRTVHIYRCPNPDFYISGGHKVGDQECWSDPTDIIIEVPTKLIAKTCLEKYKGPGYETWSNVPTWFDRTGKIYYNKCAGTSVLGSRLRVNDNEIIVKRSRGDSSSAAIAYVKPGATVNFDQFFFSAAQPVTKTIVDEGLTGAPGLPGGQWQNNYHIASTVNGANNGTWSNGTGITGAPTSFDLTTTYKFENGHSGGPTANGNNSWKVGTGDTIAQTNYGDRTNLGSASINELTAEGITNVSATIGFSPTISVAAPYNFKNTAKADATTGNNDSVVFAGETANIRGSFTTNPVANGIVVTTNGESNVYATKSPGSYLRLYTYYAGNNESSNSSRIVDSTSLSCSTLGKSNCEEYNKGDKVTLNSSENVNGAAQSTDNIPINVPDINAGQWLCAIAAVYPATSGSAANLSTDGFSGWYVSSPSCVQIAKKPTFQIWNGNLYTRGAIQSNVANKRTVSGHNEITGSNPRAFGSWVEHGIIAGGNNNNAGSGAVFGYQTNSSTNLSNNPGGHAEGTVPAVCKRAPLTIANQNCVTNNNNSGNGNSGVAVVDTVNLDDFKSTATQAQSLPVNTNVVLSSSDKYKEVNGIRYFYNASTGSKIYLSTDNLAAGANYVVYSKGSVYINGNITYTNGGYTSPSNVPQLIIITDGSIFIDGNVTRVDAWLIAKSNDSSKGVIKTCADSNGATPQSEATCSKQLRINGPIVARQLELNRVYGAAPGNNSATAAEIINLSPATYVFSQSKASDNATLRTVYSKEVAPRW